LVNYQERVDKINKVIENWQYRKLTLHGKIKSFLVSQLVYILTPLPTHTNLLKKVNDMLFDFLWGARGDKIKRKVMIKKNNEGV